MSTSIRILTRIALLLSPSLLLSRYRNASEFSLTRRNLFSLIFSYKLLIKSLNSISWTIYLSLAIVGKVTAEPVQINNAALPYVAIESIVLPDLTNDGLADHGILYLDNAINKLRLQVIDGVSLEPGTLITWNNIYDDPTLHLLTDINGNSVPEIGVFGVRNDGLNAGKAQLFARDLSSGQTARVFNWPANWTSVKPMILNDLTGDGIADVAIQGRFQVGRRPQLVVRNGATGASVNTFSYPDLFNDPEFYQHSDVNGDSISEIATFGRIKRNNKIQFKLANGTNPANRLKAYNFPDKWSDVQWIKLDDTNNDGVGDWALFGINKDDNRPQLIVKNGNDPKGALRIFAWSADLSSPQFFAIPDMNGDGVNEVAVGGRRSNGRYQFQIKDGTDRNSSLVNHNINLNLSDVSFHLIDDLTADGIVEIGFLGTNDDGAYVLQVQDGNGTNGTIAQYNFSSLWSAKPSLKNIEDINSDGLNEIAVEGIYAGQTKLQIWAIPDADSDTYPDTADAFPADGTEWLDTDSDGIGNNEDSDDDNDGMLDNWEVHNTLNPIVNDADADPDMDGRSNLTEFLDATNPQIIDEKSLTLIAELIFVDINLANCVKQTATDNNWSYVQQLTALTCSNQNIISVTGIEQLDALNTINLNHNRITAVDLSGNSQLVNLTLDNNQLITINFTDNEMLTNVSLIENPFSQATLDYLATSTWVEKLNYPGLNSAEFITKWRVKAEQQLSLEIDTQQYDYDYQVDWGDGSITNNEPQHTYTTEGVYTIKIKGMFPHANFCNSDVDTPVLIDVSQWGVIQWASMNTTFATCKELSITAVDIPDLTNVSNLAYMFRDADNFNEDISRWDVSAVTNMSSMFRGATSFNRDISSWDVSNVTEMALMFQGAASFNSDISRWNVGSVTRMYNMFFGAVSFNSDLSDWDVSNVINMKNMFAGADSFNSDISQWDVSKVTNMSSMFRGASSFDSSISDWDVSNVTNMIKMFEYATNFSSDVSAWDVVNVTNMHNMFSFAVNFNSDISDWNLCNVIDMSYMFRDAKSFNSDISGWDVSNVTNMESMFNGATSFNSDISGWDVSSVSDMTFMFSHATSFKSELFGWDVSSVTSMRWMFSFAKKFNSDLSEWDVSNVSDMRWMFWAAKLFNSDISKWDVSKVNDMSYMFLEASNFNSDISGWNVSSVTDMYYMFASAESFNSDISAWDVSAVVDMSFMFRDAYLFNGDLSGWDVSSVQSVEWMFNNTGSFSRNLSGWNVDNVTSYIGFDDLATAGITPPVWVH